MYTEICMPSCDPEVCGIANDESYKDTTEDRMDGLWVSVEVSVRCHMLSTAVGATVSATVMLFIHPIRKSWRWRYVPYNTNCPALSAYLLEWYKYNASVASATCSYPTPQNSSLSLLMAFPSLGDGFLIVSNFQSSANSPSRNIEAIVKHLTIVARSCHELYVRIVANRYAEQLVRMRPILHRTA